jgi:ribonuclease HII
MKMNSIGVDEAGRGPVIGPLVVCALKIPDLNRDVLEWIGARDSKELTAKARKIIAGQIEKAAEKYNWGIGLVICPPSRIDLNKSVSDLNSLEIELFAEAIRLSSNSNENGIILADACDSNAERFGKRLGNALGENWENWEIDSRHGMDSIDRVAGAASILAKVRRDSEIEKIALEYDFEIGSGYPSDPKTRIAINKMLEGELPANCLRWTWSTISDLWSEIHSTPVPVRTEDGGGIIQSSLDDW